MISVNPREIYDFLKGKNINEFYHANSVITSLSMIKEGGLVSRGQLEAKTLSMSPQYSDSTDKEVGVWDDIFFDIFDLHELYKRRNYYGPVCFCISSDVLLDPFLPNLCITKDNPKNWGIDMSEEEKYYSKADDYMAEFDYNISCNQIQRKMFTIHETDQAMPFKRYLNKIILDDPMVGQMNIDFYKNAYNKLFNKLYEENLEYIPIVKRDCINGEYYSKDDTPFSKKFFEIYF